MDSDSQKLAGSTQAGGAVLGAAGLIALVWSYHTQIVALAIILGGVIVVIAAVIAVAKLGVLRTRGASKAFKDDLGSKLRATPGGVTDADARAKLDDLRRSLQSGMEKLQATGKSLYVLPWYLMVGEPGSGKTKAIGAAGVALPGFQDPMQGAGGTVNMNWWFTNSGIILDTAGRLMLPEVNTGNNPEWDEFLRTLNNRRPNCPVNGLILAVPADTLITDTATEIDRKAGDIAYQFNKLQVTLGIRFPVFVLITKCDKILGFREFFEAVNQPDEQAQLLGWSNPEKLDDPFKPDLVQEHLEKVHEQLVRRRARLIQDPVHTDDPNARRTDQIDALYEFPEALVGLAPRLRRYLEPIFVAGPLSARPLFLRGIYFTSSLQTGEAVDAAMSAIMGIDIAKSHSGGVVSEKPYFLKHVFQEKVFKEKGLVTRTTNVSQLKRRRKVAVLAAAILSVLALGGFTWFSNHQLEESVGKHVAVWDDVKKWGAPDQTEMVGAEDGRYHGQSVGADKKKLVDLHEAAREEAPTEVHVPAVFRPVAWVSQDLNAERKRAYTAFFEGKVLYPLIKRDREYLQRPTASATWDQDATNALRGLINVEAKRDLTAEKPFTLDDVVPYALDAGARPQDRELWRTDRANWEKDFQWVYSKDGAGATWPPSWAADPDANRTAITKGVDAYIDHAAALAQKNQGKRDAVQLLADKLEALDNAEVELLKVGDEITTTAAGAKWEKAEPAVADWRKKSGSVQSAKDDVTTSLTALLATAKDWDQATTGLDVYYKKIVDDAIADQQKEFQALRDAIPSGTADKTLEASRDKLTRAMEDAGKARTPQYEAYAAKISKLAKIMLPPVNGEPKKRLYERQAEIVDLATRQVPGAPPAQAPTPFAPAFDALTKEIDDAVAQLGAWRKVAGANSREVDLCTLSESLTTAVSGPRRKSVLLEAAVRAAPETRDDWVARLKETRNGLEKLSIDIPVTKGVNDTFPKDQYDPRSMELVKNEWASVMTAGSFDAGVRPQGVMDWDDLAKVAKAKEKAFKAIRDEFAQYWTNGWTNDFDVRQGDSAEDWSKLQPVLANMNVDHVNDSIHAFADLRARALALVNPAAPPVAAGPPAVPLVGKVRDRLRAWGGLSPKANQARLALLSVPDDVKRAERYLLIPNVDVSPPRSPSPYEDYWTQLFVAALDSVGRSAEKQSAVAFKDLWDHYHRFPLAPADAPDPELSADELKKACDRIEEVWGPWRGKRQPAATASGQGALLPELFRVPMGRLVSNSALNPDDSAQAEWARRVPSLQPWLLALRDRTVNCQLNVLHPTDDRIARDFFYVKVAQSDAAAKSPQTPIAADLRNGPDVQPPISPSSGQPRPILVGPAPVFVGCIKETAGPVVATFALSGGSWPQLRLILEQGKGDPKDRAVTRDAAGFDVTLQYHAKSLEKEGSVYNGAFRYRVKLDDGNGDELPIDFWNGR